MTHAGLIADVNAGRLLVFAVRQFDPACEPAWDDAAKRWRCACDACTGCRPLRGLVSTEEVDRIEREINALDVFRPLSDEGKP